MKKILSDKYTKYNAKLKVEKAIYEYDAVKYFNSYIDKKYYLLPKYFKEYINISFLLRRLNRCDFTMVRNLIIMTNKYLKDHF